MKTGNGKIANLPAEIRDELNYRITEGEPGNELVEWLNSKPEVVKVLTERFDGIPISEQNLSEWRKRGYQKWLAYHNIVDESNAVTGNTDGIAATGIDCDKLLLTLAGAYAEAIQRWIITPCDQMNHKLGVYKNITNGVIAMRRAELLKVRLEIDRERLEILREKRRDKSPSRSSTPSLTPSGSPATCQPNPAPAPSASAPDSGTPARNGSKSDPSEESPAKSGSGALHPHAPPIPAVAIPPKAPAPQVAASQPNPQARPFWRKLG